MALIEKMQFSDSLVVKNQSKKRSLTKQPKFLVGNRKLSKHVMQDIDIDCLSLKKDFNEGIVN